MREPVTVSVACFVVSHQLLAIGIAVNFAGRSRPDTRWWPWGGQGQCAHDHTHTRIDERRAKIVLASGVQALGDAFISWIRGPITESWQTPR